MVARIGAFVCALALLLPMRADTPEPQQRAALESVRSWLAKGEDNKAASALEDLLKRNAQDTVALRMLASIYLRHELNDKAVSVLQRLIVLAPEDSAAYADLGAAFAGISDLHSARHHLERALELNGSNASALVGLANVELKSGSPDKALPLLVRAVRLNANASEGHYLLGLAYLKLGESRDSISELEQALKLGGNDPDILYQLSRAYKAAGRVAESEQALARFSQAREREQALQEKKREVARLLLQAAPLVQQGALRDALLLLEKATRLDGSDAQLWFRQAGLEYDLKHLDAARSSILRALQLTANDWSYHYLLGLIDSETGRLDTAHASLTRAVELNPEAVEAINALGNIAMRRKNYAEAVTQFERAAALTPGQSAYRLNAEAAKQLLQTR